MGSTTGSSGARGPQKPSVPAQNGPMLPDGVKHGTITGHKHGCRCDPCAQARRDYDAAYRAKRRAAGLLPALTAGYDRRSMATKLADAAYQRAALQGPEALEAYWAAVDAKAKARRRELAERAKRRGRIP